MNARLKLPPGDLPAADALCGPGTTQVCLRDTVGTRGCPLGQTTEKTAPPAVSSTLTGPEPELQVHRASPV